MADHTHEAYVLYKLLARPIRVRICRALAEAGELNVGAIARRLNAAQPEVSRHIVPLRLAGIIVPRREGRFIFYSLGADTRGRLASLLLFAFGLEVAVTKVSRRRETV